MVPASLVALWSPSSESLFNRCSIKQPLTRLDSLVFNRETREDGGMPPYERSYLNDTFLHTGLGIGIIGIAARALHSNGWSYRLMAANPWLVLGIGLVGSIGTMMGTRMCPPEK